MLLQHPASLLMYKNLQRPKILGIDEISCFHNSNSSIIPISTLIGYLEVTWHLTMKLFLTKISVQATLQNLWCQRVTVHCYLRMLTNNCHITARFNEFQQQNFQLWNKSLQDWPFGKHWDSRQTNYCFPWDQSLIINIMQTYNSKCIFRANKQKHSQVNPCRAQFGMLTCLMGKAKLILLLDHNNLNKDKRP